MKVALTTGAYSSRSIIASAQRCVNLYPENNPADSPFPTTHYPTPGLRLLGTAAATGYRCLYTSTAGVLFAVVGPYVYTVSASWVFTKIGTLGTSSGPVSMVDNGVDVLIVDGSAQGYSAPVGGGALASVSGAGFYGADRVDLVDNIFVLNRPGTSQFYISGIGDTTFDALDFAGKTGFSDTLVSLAVAKRYIYLFGALTTEIWYNSGDQDFTFARMPSAFIQHGCAAKHSVATMDGQCFWLAQDPQGRAVVMMTSNFDGQRISTHAIEQEIQGYSRIDDAIGFTYQQDGHYFYFLTFPTADKTWCFDTATGQWHERAWLDSDGLFHRHRAACHAFFNGTHMVGDWENGNLYALDMGTYDDNGTAQVHIRSFPHLVDDSNRVIYREFIADMEVGRGISGTSTDPEIRLRWSDTKGASWGNYVTAGLGKTGDFLRSIQFQRLGMARDRVFELSWSGNCETALNGAFVQFRGVNE